VAQLFAATGDAIARIDDGAVSLSLLGTGARCVASGDGVVIAGGPFGARTSTNGGEAWKASALEGDVFSVAVAVDGTLFAGTEPSALFVSRDGGASWRELESLQEIPSRPTWSFPPRPWTSHVRWIAPSPHEPDLLLVGIELGGLMRSDDAGATWRDHAPGAQADVHSLAWHPTERGRAYEAGGGGSAWSTDAGLTWRRVDEGRDRNYTFAVTPDVGDADVWYVSASTGPFAAHRGRDAQARIYRWEGEGPWEDLTGELDSMPYALAWLEGSLVAGLADGTLLDVESGRPLELTGERMSAVVALAVA
jgi:photosystem II stability/assembly factor-like uncharacterized protein